MPDPAPAVSPLPARAARRLLTRYRGSGADLPYGDPLRAHGVAMEGYFWRFTDPRTGRVLIALNGVNRSADGPWATLGLAAHPGGFLRTTAHLGGASASYDGLGVSAGEAFVGTADTLHVDLGPDARVEATLTDAVAWPRRSLGGSSVFQTVPALNQYWHPWLLGARVHGTAVLGAQTWDLDGWTAYGEKNWGRGGFPDSWWWGQAQGFTEPEVCVAFAGGQVSAGPLRTTVTALVVRLPDGEVVRLGDPVVSPVRAEVADEVWRLHGRSARWSVELEGRGDLGRAHVLPVPLPAERRNVPGAIEHLAARMGVVVRHRGREVWSGESASAALEHGGIARARAEVRRRGGGEEDTDAAPLVAE